MTPSRSASQPPSIQQNSSARRAPGQTRPQKGVVAAELPIAVELDQTTQLTVGGGQTPVRGASAGERRAKLHVAVAAGRIVELDFAHAARKVTEEKTGGVLVVPDVGAGAESRAGVVETAFEAVEAASGDAAGGLGAQGAEIEERGFLDRVGDVGGAERAHEPHRVALEVRQTGGGGLGGSPGVGNAGGVVIADPVGAVVAGAHDVPGEAVGEVPGEQEGDGALLTRLQIHGGGERGPSENRRPRAGGRQAGRRR